MKKTNSKLFCQLFLFGFLIVFANGCVKDEPNNNNNNNNGTVTDIDGNVYSTITIGTQVWMAANLNTTRYRDGSTIPNITDATDWSYLTTGAYCDYENNPSNSIVYGKLYNWFAVNTNLLAPVGWHIPTDAEWNILENYLGNDDQTGGKLKETGLAHWHDPNAGATNTTNFTGLPGGSRFSTGSYYNLTYTGYWWTSTGGTDPAYAWYRFLNFSTSSVVRTEDYKTNGISVRCIKD